MMSRARRVTVAAFVGLGLAAAVTASPGAMATERSADNSDWTTITESGGQTFSYKDGATTNTVSGSFQFSADFNARLESRHYSTPTFGTHVVTLGAATHCNRDEQINVDLVAEAWPGDKILGSRKVPCASGGTAAFPSISPDKFYFVLTAGAFGVKPNRVLTGHLDYP